MDVATWGFGAPFYLGLPAREAGYLLAAVYLLLVLLALRNKPLSSLSSTDRIQLALLAAGSALLGGTFLVSMPVAGPVLAAAQPADLGGPVIALFGAVPWMLAAGFLGPLPALLAAFVAGLAMGGFGTQQLLTPLAVMAQAAVFAWLVRRPYAEWPGRLARRPLLSALVLGLLFGVLRAGQEFAYSGGDFYAGLDFTIQRFAPAVSATLLEFGVAGLIAEMARISYPERWYRPQALTVGPYNRSLTARLVTVVITLGLIGGAGLTYGNWLLARSSAQEIISDQMQQTAEQAGEGVPFFIQTGRSEIRSLADAVAAQEIEGGMPALAQSSTYFTRLAVLDSAGGVRAQWPGSGLPIPLEVMAAARIGVPQEINVAPAAEGDGVQLVFVAPLAHGGGSVAGWTDLTRNPLLQPVATRLFGYQDGQAFIVDASGRILVHADPNRWLTVSEASIIADGEFGYLNSAAGGRTWVYSHPVEGFGWRVIVTTPQQVIDRLALSTTFNLFLLLFVTGAVLIAGVHVLSRRLTSPLRQMAATAEAIARGDLDRQVTASGQDEIGRLAGSFERMRGSLKARLDELNLLLSTSQRMSESFELSEALPSVLGKIRDLSGAEVVRLVLDREDGQPENYSIGQPLAAYGQTAEDWSRLDPSIAALCKERGGFELENPARAKAVLDLEGLREPPESLVAVPVTHEGRFVGTLWLGHRKPRAGSKAVHQMLSILAGQLGVSLAKVALYQRVERDRSRLMTILESTPDAVIVTDSEGRITLANPAAEAVLKLRADEAIGQPLEAALAPQELVSLLKAPVLTDRSIEIKVEGGRVLYAAASEVPGGHMGRVCVLSDITQFKILDTLKSEFVSTVSHDLRGPLTLIRGYTTMLSNVGGVNDQQRELQEKVLRSVDQMTKLVDDLLDLGRIETGIGLNPEPVEIPEILNDVLTSLRPQALNKQIALEVELDPDMVELQADPMLLRQAIANLVDNAIKYTESGGTVKLRAEQVDGRQIVQVEDTGVGIAPADQPRLFEKFFRVGEAKGSGLGLAIVKSIVEQHHGRVSVDSRLGMGSKFTIALPMMSAVTRRRHAHETG